MSINILLADDSIPAQNMGKKILMEAGYSVMTVNNGLEALRKIAEAVPDIAILDIFMPGYTGLELCKRLRASAATATLPVILTVGKLEPYRPEDGEQVQSNAVIVKPFAAAELISAVRSLIGGPLADAAAAPGVSKAVDPFPESPSRATPLPPTPEPFGEAETDEPLFAGNLGGPSAYSTGFPLSGADSDSNPPANLAFDPDAKPTPFRASAFEILSPASQSAPESGASAFTDFDLALEPSPFSAYAPPEPEHAAPEPEHAAPEPEHSMPEREAATSQTQVFTLDEPSLAAPAMVAEPFAAPEVIPSSSSAPVSMEPSTLDIPALDPLLELSPAYVPSVLSVVAELEPQDAAAELLPVSDPTQEEVSPEVEAARLAAFEALFNSTEPLPLDNIPDRSAASAPVLTSGFTELPDHDYQIEPEPETEHQPHLAAPEVQDIDSLDLSALDTTLDSTSEMLPDLLVDSLQQPELEQPELEQPEAGSEWKPEEAIAPPAIVMSSEAAQIEAQVFAEAPPETPLAYQPAPLPDLMPTEEFATQLRRVPMAPETLPTEPSRLENVQHSAVPDVAPIQGQPPAPEPLRPEAEMPLADPLVDVPVADVPVEVAPLEAAPAQVEAAQVEAAPLSVPDEAEPLEGDQLQSESPTGEIFPSPAVSSRLLEAERIHRAIERVFDRFKPLLVAAIVRELARQDHD